MRLPSKPYFDVKLTCKVEADVLVRELIWKSRIWHNFPGAAFFASGKNEYSMRERLRNVQIARSFLMDFSFFNPLFFDSTKWHKLQAPPKDTPPLIFIGIFEHALRYLKTCERFSCNHSRWFTGFFGNDARIFHVSVRCAIRHHLNHKRMEEELILRLQLAARLRASREGKN